MVTFAGMSTATAYSGNTQKVVKYFDEKCKVCIYFFLWHDITLCCGTSHIYRVILCLIVIDVTATSVPAPAAAAGVLFVADTVDRK